MTSAVRTSVWLHAAVGLLVAQLVLQLLWHAWLAPGSRAALALAVLPLVPGLWLALRDLRRGVLVGAIASLLYFCHGIAELMRASAPHALPAAEVALAVAVVATLYADVRAARDRAAAARAARD